MSVYPIFCCCLTNLLVFFTRTEALPVTYTDKSSDEEEAEGKRRRKEEKSVEDYNDASDYGEQGDGVDSDDSDDSLHLTSDEEGEVSNLFLCLLRFVLLLLNGSLFLSFLM
jgi:hypothetical protein